RAGQRRGVLATTPWSVVQPSDRKACRGADLGLILRFRHPRATGSFDYTPFASRSGAPLRMTPLGSFSTACQASFANVPRTHLSRSGCAGDNGEDARCGRGGGLRFVV